MRLHGCESIRNALYCQAGPMMPCSGAWWPFLGHFKAFQRAPSIDLSGCSVGCVQFFTELLCKKMNKAKLGSNPLTAIIRVSHVLPADHRRQRLHQDQRSRDLFPRQRGESAHHAGSISHEHGRCSAETAFLCGFCAARPVSPGRSLIPYPAR